MLSYVKLPGGAVCTAVEATEADLKGVTPHYARVFIPAAARVRITVQVGADSQVIFDGTIVPTKTAGVLEIRVRRHADVAAVPVEPKKMTKAEAELGM